MVSPWNLTSELLDMSSCSNLEQLGAYFGYSPGESFELIEGEHGWVRLGVETFVYDFSITGAHGIQNYYMKACAPLSACMPVGELCDLWFARRQLLSESGANTPKLILRKGATWVEESIPYTLREVLEREFDSDALINSLAANLAALYSNSFHPISLHDLRSRGDDAVMVDFGWDIGGSDSALHSTLDTWLVSIFSGEAKRVFGSSFLAHVRTRTNDLIGYGKILDVHKSG